MKPIKGLYQDCLPEDQPEGTYRNARNILVGKLNKAVANEDGLKKICDTGFNIIHVTTLDADRYVLFQASDADGTGSRVSLVDVQGNLTDILVTDQLGFTANKQYKSVWTKNFNNETVIAWVDGEAPKILNIDAVPFELNDDRTPKNTEDLGLLELFPKFKQPQVEFRKYNDTGGQLQTGTYYIAFGYELPDGGSTNWGRAAGPFMITSSTTAEGSDSFKGAEAGSPTSKSIELELTQIDIRYKYIRIAVMKRIGGTYTAEYIGKQLISDSSAKIVYTGAENAEIIPLEEFLSDKSSYTSAKTLTLLDNRLYLGNLEKADEINYQKWANNIKINWITDKVRIAEARGSFKDEVTIYNSRGFFPDEVYAFYVMFHMKDGSYSPAFHIPGRPSGQITFEGRNINENASLQQVYQANPALDLLKHDLNIDQDIRYFHTRETAKADGTMGYWENSSETYPDTEDYDIWDETGKIGTLRPENGMPKNVRHHKFPSLDMIVNSRDGIIGTIEATDPEVTWKFMNPAKVDYGYGPEYLRTAEGDYVMLDDDNTDTIGWGYYNESLNTFEAIKEQDVTITGSVDIQATASDYEYFGPRAHVKASLRLKITRRNGTVEELYFWQDERTSNLPYGDPYYPETVHAQVINTDFNETFKLNYGDSFSVEPYVLAEGGEREENVTINLTVKCSAPVEYLMDDKAGKVYGIRVSDIYIPDQIKDKVTGLEIMYAKRNSSNMRVIGQCPVFHNMGTSVLEKNACGPGIGNFTLPTVGIQRYMDDSTARLHCFDLMKEMPAFSPSFIKTQAVLSTKITDLKYISGTNSTNDDSTDIQAHFLADFIEGTEITTEDNYAEDKKLRSISGYQYFPGDVQTNIAEKQFDNTWGEGHINAKIKHFNSPVTTTDNAIYGWGIRSGNFNHSAYGTYTEKIILVNIYQHRKDMYKSFASQELASTNVVLSIGAASKYTINRVFGGDTYFNNYGIRLTAPVYKAGTQSTNKFEAVKAIYHFPVYSVNNIALRHAESAPESNFFPNTGRKYAEYKKWISRAADTLNSNTFLYNADYTAVNDMNRAFPFSSDVKVLKTFPYRIIRSKAYAPETKDVTLRSFLPNDYFEMTRARGEITNLEAFQNILFIHMRDSLFKTAGSETLKTGSVEVTLGTGDIFRMPPTELLTTKGGYLGCQHMSSCCVTKLGYFFTDAAQGKVFLVSSDIKEISNLGMRGFFFSHTALQSDRIPKRYLDPLLHRSGYAIAFDEQYNRILFSKKDCRLSEKVYNHTEGEIPQSAIVLKNDRLYRYPDLTNELSATDVQLLIKDCSLTMSYSPEQNWICFHDYSPVLMANTRSSIISVSGKQVYLHNVPDNPGAFYDRTYPSFVDVVSNEQPETAKLFGSVSWKTTVQSSAGYNIPDQTFSHILLYDSQRCSGLVQLVNLENTRSAEGEWRFNRFRNIVLNRSLPFIDSQGNLIDQNLDPNKPWYSQGRFIDNYIIVRLLYDNVRKNNIYLYSVDTTYRASDR